MGPHTICDLPRAHYEVQYFISSIPSHLLSFPDYSRKHPLQTLRVSSLSQVFPMKYKPCSLYSHKQHKSVCHIFSYFLIPYLHTVRKIREIRRIDKGILLYCRYGRHDCLLIELLELPRLSSTPTSKAEVSSAYSCYRVLLHSQERLLLE